MCLFFSFAVVLIVAVGNTQCRNCPAMFECLDGVGCQLREFFCDGYTDCSDGSDENTSFPTAYSGYRTCFGRSTLIFGWGPCLLREEYFCDGESMCAEDLDECFCGERNKDHISELCFRCFGNSEENFAISKVCDGRLDCTDLTDECLCQPTARPEICEKVDWEGQKPYLRCKESSNSKLVDINVCDMKSDCNFTEKERHCQSGSPGKTCYLAAPKPWCKYETSYPTSITTCLGDNLHCNVILDQHQPLSTPKVKLAIMAVAMSWFISTLIGLMPLLHSFEDYFLKDVLFNDTAIFKTKVNQNDKQHVINWLGLLNNGKIQDQGDSTEWDKLRRLVSQINIYSPIKAIYEFGYYSSHTVCLPTFFPDRKQYGSWVYSFVLLILNLLAFVFMLVCYIALYRKAANRKIVESSSARDKREKQNAAMQRKLTRILMSDFLCWVPVCIMGFLQLAGIDVPTDAYLPTGLLILPINSALNPFLYSNLPDMILSRGRSLITWLADPFRTRISGGTSQDITSVQVNGLELDVIERNRVAVAEMD